MPSGLVVTTAAEGRTPEPLNVVGEATLIKVGPEDCEGRYALFHLVAPPMTGPPLHVHSREDECFYVLSGELIFEVDGACHTIGAGGCIAVMRGMVHRYQNFTNRDAALLIVTTPGDFAGFFVDISAATPAGGVPTMDQLLSIGDRYGITTLGPPMMTPPSV